MYAISQPFYGWQKIRCLRVGHPASLGMGTVVARRAFGPAGGNGRTRASSRAIDGHGWAGHPGMGLPPGADGRAGKVATRTAFLKKHPPGAPFALSIFFSPAEISKKQFFFLLRYACSIIGIESPPKGVLPHASNAAQGCRSCRHDERGGRVFKLHPRKDRSPQVDGRRHCEWPRPLG